MRIRFLFLFLVLFLVAGGRAFPIGVRMHAEIGRMAVEQYLKKDVILPEMTHLFEDDNNLRALYLGCAFPDWGFGGINQDPSEFSHWRPFMEAYISLLKDRFPPPWDAEAQRQICFFLGILSHNMTDIPWHFSEEGQKSFLQAGYDADVASHVEIEVACDIILHGEKAIQPAVGLMSWFPLDSIMKVFEATGQPVTRWQVIQGMLRGQAMFWGGWMVGLQQWNTQKAKVPWAYEHRYDYYYGGMEHGAAITSVVARDVYTRLQGGYYFQNTPEYAPYVRHDDGYLPSLHVEDNCIRSGYGGNDAGKEPFIEVGGNNTSRHYGLIKADISEVPGDYKLKEACLWLYLAASPESPPLTPITLNAYRIMKPWTSSENLVAPNGDGLNPEYVSEPVVSFVYAPGTIQVGWVRMDITSMANDWIALPGENHGLVLQLAGEESENLPVLRFYSSDAFKGREDGYCGGTLVAHRPLFLLMPN